MATFDIQLDQVGFPLIWIESLNAYMHWLPVTKIQFEYFLCAEPDPQFDAQWYETLLKLNPRVSPQNLTNNNYWGALLSGILPAEAGHYARWCGTGYALPTLDEWRKAYNFLKTQPVQPQEILNQMKQQYSQKLSERVLRLLTQLETIQPRIWRDAELKPTSLADQMLMRMGVLEWVESNELRNHWGGMGQTHARFHGSMFTPDHGQPSRPNDPENVRLHHYGFRLLWRPT